MTRIPPLFFTFLLAPCALLAGEPADEGEVAGMSGEAEFGAGSIQGTIREARSGDPIDGASISVLGTGPETATGPQGTYRLDKVPAGVRTIEASKEGLGIARLELEVRDGEVSAADLLLGSAEGESAESFEVKGKRPVGTMKQKLEERRVSVENRATVSAEEIKRGVAGNAAAVAQTMPGTHTVDGKYVYVRGLGDRYSQTLVNGSSIPSPEPDKRVIPLDLFPANLLESLSVVKTYSPDMPGEFAGGSVQIKTKDIPESDFFTFGLEAKYRDGTSFRDFKTYHGGNFDMFTFDDGTRALPGDVPSTRVGQGINGMTDQDIQSIGRSFQNIWEPGTITAPLDHKLSLSFGKRLGEPGISSLGIIGAINWANKYQTTLDESRRILMKGGTSPQPSIFNDFSLDTWTSYAELSGMLGVTWEINEGNKVGIRTLYTRGSEDQVRNQTGYDAQADRDVFITRLRWVERSLLSIQPFGEHLLWGDTFLEWRLGYALSQRDEPDNRQTRYEAYGPPVNAILFRDVSGNARRDYFLLDENIYSLDVDWSIPFAPFVEERNPESKIPEQRIKLGPSLLFRDRNFDGRRFRYLFSDSTPLDQNGNPIDLTGSPEDILKNGNISPQGFYLDELTRSSDNYDATQVIIGGYGLVDFRIVPSLRLQAGVRVENSNQELVGVDRFPVDVNNPEKLEKSKLETTDILPSANLIWEFLKNMQLRLGGSQTVNRPEFRELARFEYSDVEGGYSVHGNPDLQRAKIYSADLAWEWFPSPGDLFSVGLFYKYLDQPIETVMVPSSSTKIMTWQNAQSANLYGVEFEVRKNLGFLAPESLPELADFNVVSNLALIASEVTIPESTTVDGLVTVQTNSHRPLQGQSPYLFNFGLLYDSKKNGLSAGVFMNTSGERISAVGAFGVPDEYEQPRWNLDANIAKTFGKATLKITGENLLDDKYEYKQGGITTRSYTRGWLVGLTYIYTF